MEKTKSRISIGDLRFRPFNRLRLKDIYAADLKNDTLFYAETLEARFDLFKMLRKQFVIHSVEIDRFDLRVSRAGPDTPFNFQFLSEAFASDTAQTAAGSVLRLAVDHIRLKDGHLRYDIHSEPFQPPGLFDANHVDIRNLQLDATFHYTDPDDWSGSIENFSLDEKNGFALTQLKLRVKNFNKQVQIDRFYISLPHSEGEIREASLDYRGLQPGDALSGAAYSLSLASGKWFPGDFACFYPELVNYPETITCSGSVEGIYPGISIPRLELNYGKRLQSALSAGISDCKARETSAFELNVEKCLIDTGLFKLPVNIDAVSLTGKLTGSLTDFKASLTAESKQGSLSVTGTGGYWVSSGNTRFDLNVESPGYDLKALLSDSTFGNVSFHLMTQGTITAGNKINAKAEAQIRQLDFRGYGYGDISANAVYDNDSVSVELTSKDPHLAVHFQGEARLNKNNPFVRFSGQLTGVHPGELNLLPEYPGSELSGSIKADIRGFDPELMDASVVIGNLQWITSSDNFNAPSVTISYHADAEKQKQINVRSPVLNVRAKGNFTYNGIIRSFRQTFPVLSSSDYSKFKQEVPDDENLDFVVGIRQINAVAHVLGMETNVPDSALFIGKYNSEGENLNMNVTAFCIFNQSDTARLQLDLTGKQGDIFVQLGVRNKSNQYDLEGNTGAAVKFVARPGEHKSDINIATTPGSLVLNGTAFRINPTEITIKDKRYEISNFALRHSTSEYLKADGTISENAGDSLLISVNRFEIGTGLSALKNKIPLSGTASGDFTLSRLMSNPLVFTRNFTIENMVFDKNPIGNLQLRSAWSSERQGLALRAAWTPPNAPESTLSGFFLTQKDSLALTADIRGIRLKWFDGYLPENISDLGGELGVKIKVNGKPKDPVLAGTIYLNDAIVGIPMLNTKYRMTDSIALENDQITFRDCMIYDETGQFVKINGNIKYHRFETLIPQLTLDLDQLLVLNNSDQTDSLFYGLLRTTGKLTIVSQNKNWLLKGNLSNGRANKIRINLPESTLEAQRYNWLTFAGKKDRDSIAVSKRQKTGESSDFSFPLKLQISLSVDPGLSIGAVINPETKDAATVTGRGVLDLSYNLNDPLPRLLGTYTINDGNCTLSLKNITKKTFLIQPGGKLNFQGDPMNTAFDLTAIYSLRAYLTSLDPSFASLLTASKIPVNCLLTAGGKMNDMTLKYRIELPNQSDEIQRKLDGLIYSDEIKIKQMAYLLAFGSFLPMNSGPVNSGNASIWTSLASASITTQLNHLLSGVLADNWTIGTDLHSNDANFSNVDMDVNVSTRIFNDRLTINGTLGYHNSTDQINNFTGDFNLEYLLTPRGNLLLQFYNVTNNQYYDKSKSPLTQGVGIVYKREGRTFKQLFRSLRLKRRQ